MEKQKTSSKQIMINYGLLLGLVSILISVANYAFGNIYKPHWIVTVIGFIIPVVFIVMGIKKVKEQNNGYLKLGEAIKTALGIVLISAILFLIYFILFTNFIEPEFYARSLEFKKQIMLDTYPNMSDEQLENAMKMQEKFSNNMTTSAFIIIFNLVYGLIVGLIGGLIMKKSEEEVTSI